MAMSVKQSLWRGRWFLTCTTSLGISFLSGIVPVHALPGQRVDDVIAWIRAHPTLQPGRGEQLLIRRSDTPARRFTFQASRMPPGRTTATRSDVIRSEQLTLVDLINGINRDRLESSLRTIYGRELYQDYEQSSIVYTYPASEITDPDQLAPPPVMLQGELRQGDRFAYWLETTQNTDGLIHTAQITVFLKDDVEKLQTELQERGISGG